MIVGILPAAGTAARMSGLPKFLLPIPGTTLIGWHCQRLQAAGVEELLLGYSDSTALLLHRNAPPGAMLYNGGNTLAHTVNNARLIAGDSAVVFGMPAAKRLNAVQHEPVEPVLESGPGGQARQNQAAGSRECVARLPGDQSAR